MPSTFYENMCIHYTTTKKEMHTNFLNFASSFTKEQKEEYLMRTKLMGSKREIGGRLLCFHAQFPISFYIINRIENFAKSIRNTDLKNVHQY